MFENNISILDLKQLTKGEVDALIVIGDITNDDYIRNKIKNSKSFTLICNDKSTKLDGVNFIHVVDDNMLPFIETIVRGLTNNAVINLQIDDLKELTNNDCIAFVEKGDNIETLGDRIHNKLESYNICDELLVYLNSNDDSTSLWEAEKIDDKIRSNLSIPIIFAFGIKAIKSKYEISIIARLRK